MYKIKKLRSSYLAQFILTGSILVLFLALTNPLELPLVILLVPFAVLFVCIRSLLFITLKRLHPEGTRRKMRVLSSGIALIIVFIIVLQSLGQLSWRDILLTVGFIGAVTFYFSKTDLI